MLKNRVTACPVGRQIARVSGGELTLHNFICRTEPEHDFTVPLRPPVAALAVFLSLGCNSKDGKPNATPSSPDAGKKAADLKADFSTSATQLAKEFLADEKAATAKYTGKVIEVEGVVNTANPAHRQARHVHSRRREEE